MNEEHVNRTTRIVARGNISGQIAIGDNNRLVRGTDVTQTDLAVLRQAFFDLRVQVEKSVAPELQGVAQEHVAELEHAIIAEKPDLKTMERVKKWFMRNVPSITGAVTSIIVDPIVGKLVAAGGDALVLEFDQRFGA